MNGFISPAGYFIDIGSADHKTGAKKLGLDLYTAETIYVCCRDIDHEDVQKLDERVKKQFQKGITSYTHTERKKYTLAQLEFLQKNNCYIDIQKL